MKAKNNLSLFEQLISAQQCVDNNFLHSRLYHICPNIATPHAPVQANVYVTQSYMILRRDIKRNYIGQSVQ